MEARRNGKSRVRRYGRSFEEKSTGTGRGSVGGAEVVATAVVVVKVYNMEERVPVIVMGVGKGSERACKRSCRLKSQSGHTKDHRRLMEGRSNDACVEEWEW